MVLPYQKNARNYFSYESRHNFPKKTSTLIQHSLTAIMHFIHCKFMRNEVLSFIKNKAFPCIMARAVATRGLISVVEINDVHDKHLITEILQRFYLFIDEYHLHPQRLSSFIVCFEMKCSFDKFEKFFWKVLKLMDETDKKYFRHDPRVSGDPFSPDFSFSIKEEAFFILALHPESPRFARRFRFPAIVFNPHQQFENLRKNGVYTRVRNIIRSRDKMLQGFINPMVQDFGERSEVFQYTGKTYTDESTIPFLKGH